MDDDDVFALTFPTFLLVWPPREGSRIVPVTMTFHFGAEEATCALIYSDNDLAERFLHGTETISSIAILSMRTPAHLFEVLQKIKGEVGQAVIDYVPNSKTLDRRWPIESILENLKNSGQL